MQIIIILLSLVTLNLNAKDVSSSFFKSEIRFSCHRGPLAGKVWIDSPTHKLIEKFKKIGYGHNQAIGLGFLLCRSRKYATLNGSQIKNYKSNKEKVDRYIELMSEAINHVSHLCPPGKQCHSLDFTSILPLEGRQHNWIGFPIPVPLNKNVVTNEKEMSLCEKGDTEKLWIDRPSVELIEYLSTNSSFDQLESLGIAYSACRNPQLKTSSQISKFLNKFVEIDN